MYFFDMIFKICLVKKNYKMSSRLFSLICLGCMTLFFPNNSGKINIFMYIELYFIEKVNSERK